MVITFKALNFGEKLPFSVPAFIIFHLLIPVRREITGVGLNVTDAGIIPAISLQRFPVTGVSSV